MTGGFPTSRYNGPGLAMLARPLSVGVGLRDEILKAAESRTVGQVG